MRCSFVVSEAIKTQVVNSFYDPLNPPKGGLGRCEAESPVVD